MLRHSLESKLELLKDALTCTHPHPSIVYAARYLVTEYDSERLPDWVKKLADLQSFETWEDVVRQTRLAIAAK